MIPSKPSKSENTTPSALRVFVVGPIYGGSLPIARYSVAALRRLGNHVEYFDASRYSPMLENINETFRSQNAATRAKTALVSFLSELIVQQALEFRPHLVFVLAQAPLNTAMVRFLRNKGIVTAFWFVENYRLFPYWRQTAPAYDFFFTIQKDPFLSELEAIGVHNAHYVPTGCDPTVHRPLALNEAEIAFYGSDVSFAGAAYPNRIATFESLVDKPLKLWGLYWESSQLLKPFVQKNGQAFSTDEMVKIFCASKISLNLHSSMQATGIDSQGDFFNPRLFELAACGAFQLTDQRPGLEEIFNIGSEIVTFRDTAHLRQAIDYYLQHEDERRMIAERARNRVLRDHTYDQRFTEMLKYMFKYAAGRLPHHQQKYLTASQALANPANSPELQGLLKACPPDTPLTLNSLNTVLPIGLGNPQSLSDSQAILLLLNEITRQSQEH
jgi:spore maturation protein CgeB